MSFWKKLFGAAAPQPQESPWEDVKRVAREDEQLRRDALERTPRASPEQMATRVASLRSVDQVHKAYSEMRHADFCDAVAEAVRAGNFSDPDASHALFAREWVLTGGALRTSLPEWIAGDGRARFALLTERWLRSGEKHTTFNHWLVGPVTPKATPTPAKPAPAIQQKPEAKSKPSTETGKWRVQGSKLVCDYELSGLPPPQTTTSLKIECTVSRWDNGTLATYLTFYLTPYLYLIPDAEPFEPHLVKAPFALGLVADGSGLGTEASPLVQGGMFEVNASANEDVPDTAILGIISSRDTALVTRTLALGKDLTMTLIDYETEPPVKLRLRLKGDPNFAQLYEKLRRTV
jgi:hypothetical protein